MAESAERLLEVYENTKPLTEWEKEPSIEDLKADLIEATPYHESQVAKVTEWLNNLHTKGKASIKKVKGRSTLVPKLIRKQAEWRYAALSEPFLSDDDLFKTAPVTYEDKQAAIQNGLVLNNQFNTQLNKTKFIDDYVRSAVDEGTVIVRTGWDFKEIEEEVEVPIIELRPITDPNMVQHMLSQNMPPVEEVQIGTRLEKQMVTIRNQPDLTVCSYKDIIIDPLARGDMSKANFTIYQFPTSLSELEKEGRYHNLDLIELDKNSILTAPDSSFENDNSFNFKDKPRKKIMAYEYWGFWDIDGTGITKPIIATWVGDTIIRMEENPFPDQEIPFVVIPYLPVRFSVYGEPDGALLEDNQKILGAVARGIIDVMGRSAAGQKGIRQDALDITQERKYEAGEDYKFNAHVDPRQAMYDHTYPEIPNSAQFMMEYITMDAESLTGVKAFQGGVNGDSLGQTATGVRSALDAASKREMGILRRLADGIIQIGRKVMAMNAVFLSEEEIIRVTNEEFIPVKRDDLAGKVDITLHISTAETDNAKAQELAFMLQTMGNSMPFEMSQLILSDIARLRKMPELSKAIKEYQPKPDPMQQQIQQLEMAKLQKEIEKIDSEIIENKAEAALDQAKARETGSKADLEDLKFVEQEEGVAHGRDMERQSAQAEANMDLKVLEQSLKGGTDLEKERIRAQTALNKNNQPNSN